jgi:energy-converting hydrogenase A subunit M
MVFDIQVKSDMIILSSTKGDISMNHTQHPYMEQARRLERRADSALDFLAAIAIGVGFALLITAWWTA